MKKTTWHRWHKWVGLVFCFFLLMFCVSGIVLNHRHMYGKVNVSRGWLPRQFQFHNWNNGLLRGSLRVDDNVLVYGAGGIWQTDTIGKAFCDFNKGMSESADSRNIRAVVEMPNGTLFAVAPYDIWVNNPAWLTYVDGCQRAYSSWRRIPVGDQSKIHPTRFTDATVHGDTLVLLSRSEVYISLPPYRTFKAVALKAPADYDGKVSLFRTVWMLHSGELFGLPGKVFMDVMALLIIFFCVTGIIIWLVPKYRKRTHSNGKFTSGLMRYAVRYHELLGRKTIILTVFVCVTGWMLRPPVLIALVKNTTKPVPYSQLDSDNAWKDKLRMIRWDETQHDWLLSTSSGFYSLKSFDAVPVAVKDAPPVSVMGLNVFEGINGSWVIGSFSGLYSWNRSQHILIDVFTNDIPTQMSGAPFGKIAVCGFTDDIQHRLIVNTWYDGVMDSHMTRLGEDGDGSLPQPSQFVCLPMSVWSLALEVHTGRIYTFMCGAETLLYVFVAGIVALFVLWSGWKIRRRKNTKS